MVCLLYTYYLLLVANLIFFSVSKARKLQETTTSSLTDLSDDVFQTPSNTRVSKDLAFVEQFSTSGVATSVKRMLTSTHMTY